MSSHSIYVNILLLLIYWVERKLQRSCTPSLQHWISVSAYSAVIFATSFARLWFLSCERDVCCIFPSCLRPVGRLVAKGEISDLAFLVFWKDSATESVSWYLLRTKSQTVLFPIYWKHILECLFYVVMTIILVSRILCIFEGNYIIVTNLL